MIVLDTARHVARERHDCDSCGRAIEAGAEYVRQRSVYEGEPGTYKAHADCWRAEEIVCKAFDLGGEPLPGVLSMAPDDRAAVAAADPALAAALWPAG